MTYDIYYLVYGVKLDTLFMKKLIDHVVESGDFDLEMIEETCLEDGYDWNKIKDTTKRYDYIDEDYLENYFFTMIEALYQGDSYIGKQIWSTEMTDWTHTKCVLEKDLPKLQISDEDKQECLDKIHSFKELLPDELKSRLPDVGFYWCIGTS